MKSAKEKDHIDLFIRIDLHKIRWHLNIRTDDTELFSRSIPGEWKSLRKVLERYKDYQMHAVYEAGCFGFWLYDRLRHGPIVIKLDLTRPGVSTSVLRGKRIVEEMNI